MFVFVLRNRKNGIASNSDEQGCVEETGFWRTLINSALSMLQARHLLHIQEAMLSRQSDMHIWRSSPRCRRESANLQPVRFGVYKVEAEMCILRVQNSERQSLKDEISPFMNLLHFLAGLSD